MEQGKGGWIMQCFVGLEDPRIDRCKRRQLLDIITIAICGADSWVHVEMFGRSKEDWFRTFLDLPHGIPSHDTFGDVFSRLDPDRFQECFMEWSRSVAGLLPGEVAASGGKTVRRSHGNRAGKQAIHLVSAWASANTLTLGQVKTEEKSNGITAIPRLLELLELIGLCSVTSTPSEGIDRSSTRPTLQNPNLPGQRQCVTFWASPIWNWKTIAA